MPICTRDKAGTTVYLQCKKVRSECCEFRAMAYARKSDPAVWELYVRARVLAGQRPCGVVPTF